MKLFSWLFVGLIVVAGAGVAGAAGSSAPTMLTPDALHWVAGTGPAKGTMQAVLVGAPDKSGNSIVRVQMPDGRVNQPHYHSHPEYITVIKGALLFGVGDTVNAANARLLPVGSFIMVPAGVHHWSIAKGDTIEQVGGEGPLTNIPVKQAAM